MKSSNQEARAIYVKERNHKISSILVLLITIFEKVSRQVIQDRASQIKIMRIFSNLIFTLEHLWSVRPYGKGLLGRLCNNVINIGHSLLSWQLKDSRQRHIDSIFKTRRPRIRKINLSWLFGTIKALLQLRFSKGLIAAWYNHTSKE